MFHLYLIFFQIYCPYFYLSGKNISGLAKLQKRIQSEKEFVEELLSGQIRLQQSHVECSNLGYLAAVFDIVCWSIYTNKREQKKHLQIILFLELIDCVI